MYRNGTLISFIYTSAFVGCIISVTQNNIIFQLFIRFWIECGWKWSHISCHNVGLLNDLDNYMTMPQYYWYLFVCVWRLLRLRLLIKCLFIYAVNEVERYWIFKSYNQFYWCINSECFLIDAICIIFTEIRFKLPFSLNCTFLNELISSFVN